MSGQILALFAVSLGAVMLELLVPGEDKGGPRQILHFLTALVVLVMILRPFLSLLCDADGFFDGEVTWVEDSGWEEDYEAQFAKAVEQRSAERLTAGIYDLLEKELGLDAKACRVDVTFEETGALKQIRVTLIGVGLLQDPEAVAERLGQLFACDVEVR